MSLKKNKFFYFFIFFIFSFNTTAYSEKDKKLLIQSYLGELKYFSASFVQDDAKIISEGKIFIGYKRLRVEYNSPSKILIILDKDKAMYYNYDLDEDEFFDPKDTGAWFFYDTFNNPNFFNEAKLFQEDNNIVLEKIGNNDIGKFKIEVLFEDKPLVIRRIKLFLDGEYLSLSIFNHKYNEVFDKRFFKLINPILLD